MSPDGARDDPVELFGAPTVTVAVGALFVGLTSTVILV